MRKSVQECGHPHRYFIDGECWKCKLEADRKAVAQRCCEIVSKTGIATRGNVCRDDYGDDAQATLEDAVEAIRREFGLEEGTDGA